MLTPFYVAGVLSLYLWSRKVCDRLNCFLQLYCGKLASLVSPGKRLSGFDASLESNALLLGDIQEIYDGIIRKSWILFALGIAGTFLAVSFYVTILLDYFTLGKILHNVQELQYIFYIMNSLSEQGIIFGVLNVVGLFFTFQNPVTKGKT